MNQFVPSARFAPPEKLQVKLVSGETSSPESRTWDGAAQQLIAAMDTPKPGKWRVTGTADSGVTSLIVDAVLARIASGVSPSEIVVLATSKESGALLRKEFAKLLPSVGYVSETPLVQSVHSFAFSLVRLARLRNPESAEDASLGRTPRLITGAQQDLIIQELLQIHAESEDNYWPDNVRDALTMVGFARQLRDFLLRSQERGLGPEQLQGLGHVYNRPMWVAAGKFLQEYEEITQLTGAQLYNASELVVAAHDHLNADEAFREAMQERIDSLFVDDAQNLDPQAAQLIGVFTHSAQCAVLAGNPEHSVFHFRGATPDSLTSWPVDHEIVLDRRRHAPRQQICYTDSEATQHLVVADTLRRAHLIDGTSWDEMAVIVRSSSSIPAVRRALLSAGVPVSLQPTSMVLAQQRLVSGLLLALTLLTEPLTTTELEELILGPIGGADPVTLRRLLRGLRQAEMKRGGTRRATDVLADILRTTDELPTDTVEYLTQRELDILLRLTGVLKAGRAALAQGASIELTLWEVWDATGLSDRLMNASLRGGALGSQADIDLDAVMALFDAAGDFVERHPAAPLMRFVSTIREEELPSGTRDRRGFAPEAVSILTAHSCIGRHWPLVVVCGVQEGQWPALGETGSLFGQEELVQLHDRDIDPNVITSNTKDKVAEERRLFLLACSRATHTLLVTAVTAPDSDEVDEPSRFVTELAEDPDVLVTTSGTPESFAELNNDIGDSTQFPRLLSQPSIVAELRRTLEAPDAPEHHKREAARQLARLAEAGIHGAHPDTWWGLAAPSEAEPIMNLNPPVQLSPSKIESALVCPLRTVLSEYGEEDDSPLHLFKGILIHAGAEAYARSVPRADIEKMLTEAFIAHTDFPAWLVENELTNWKRTLDRTFEWLDKRTNELVGVEYPVNVVVSALPDGTPIAICGRIDRLEKQADDALLVIDLKTGKHGVSKDDAKVHPQLFAYQLALAHAEVGPEGATTSNKGLRPEVLGGGWLVYPASEAVNVTERQQPMKDEQQLTDFAALLPEVVTAIQGPQFQAHENLACDRCVLRTMCPAHPEGKALTNV
ncbi:ATP-dependent helicase [Corynebacterium hindlerae]|uniref:ATP-dependent DNA helicase n=1 Tax=Corynebacterium hindlerae TaxID=699041 RepID=UPI001AD7365A|nr:ATP-dependent DNA helicase [Corynebacterium hindlerae]QTH60433.1 ATP-dependent helicase [Corynebacterium hindlerae]